MSQSRREFVVGRRGAARLIETCRRLYCKLVKEAAEEAENMPEVVTPLTSVDIKKSSERLLQDKVAKQIGYVADRKTYV